MEKNNAMNTIKEKEEELFMEIERAANDRLEKLLRDIYDVLYEARCVDGLDDTLDKKICDIQERVDDLLYEMDDDAQEWDETHPVDPYR